MITKIQMSVKSVQVVIITGIGLQIPFFNGNWKDGVLQLLGLNVSPREFAEFINEKVAEGFEDIGDFLDRDAFVTITELWYNLKS